MHSFETASGNSGFEASPLDLSKLRDLEAWLRRRNGVAVAFSGGVDSTLLLAVASEILGDRAVAFTAVSPSLQPEERSHAKRLAQQLDVAHQEIATDELGDVRYRDNRPDRCFHCKTHLFTKVIDLARKRGIDVVIDGNNRDDASDHRPGRDAARRLGVRSPLDEVGLAKDEIRRLARHRGLEVWNKPAMPCLASRIPYFAPVTEEKLMQIARAEAVLRAKGFNEVRVRHHGDVARIEVPVDRIADLVAPAQRGRLAASLEAIGFSHVTVDLAGFKSGNLNRVLTQSDKTSR